MECRGSLPEGRPGEPLPWILTTPQVDDDCKDAADDDDENLEMMAATAAAAGATTDGVGGQRKIVRMAEGGGSDGEGDGGEAKGGDKGGDKKKSGAKRAGASPSRKQSGNTARKPPKSALKRLNKLLFGWLQTVVKVSSCAPRWGQSVCAAELAAVAVLCLPSRRQHDFAAAEAPLPQPCP